MGGGWGRQAQRQAAAKGPDCRRLHASCELPALTTSRLAQAPMPGAWGLGLWLGSGWSESYGTVGRLGCTPADLPFAFSTSCDATLSNCRKNCSREGQRSHLPIAACTLLFFTSNVN